jgi:hypothetical protein
VAGVLVLGVTRLDRNLSIVAMMVMMMLHVALSSVLIVWLDAHAPQNLPDTLM